jgi:hypothetical protein
MTRVATMLVAVAVGISIVVVACREDKEDRAEPLTRPQMTSTMSETTPSSTIVPVAPPAKPLTVIKAEESRAATGLKASAECSAIQPGVALAALGWHPARHRGTEQRIAMTIFPAGFENGEYRLGDPLGGSVSSLEWRAIEGQAIHYWRVLTLQRAGWVASSTATFTGPMCVADEGTP